MQGDTGIRKTAEGRGFFRRGPEGHAPSAVYVHQAEVIALNVDEQDVNSEKTGKRVTYLLEYSKGGR